MKRNWTLEELVDFFTITPSDLKLIANKTGATRLGFTVLLKAFQVEAKYPSARGEYPHDVINFIARQLNVEPTLFKSYDIENRSCRYHKNQIRKYLGFRETTNEDNAAVAEWLSENFECYNKSKVTLAAYQRFRDLKVEPPSSDRLERLVNSSAARYEKIMFERLHSRISDETKILIDTFISTPMKDSRHESFSTLKSDPKKIGLESVLNEIHKLETIKKLKIPSDIFEDIHPKVLKAYKQRVSSELLGEIRRHPPEVKYSLLSVFFWRRKKEIIDNLADLLIAVIHKIDSKAVRKVEKEILNDIKRVHGKYNILRSMAELSLNNPEGTIRDVIFPNFDEQLLQDLIKDLSMNNSEFRGRVYTVMKNSYSRHYRRMIPALLEGLDFKSNNDIHKPVLNALIFVKDNFNSTMKEFLLKDNIPVSGVIKHKWKDTVICQNDQGEMVIQKFNYEICVLQALREKLRCKEIWLMEADKYRNPEEDIPEDFDRNRRDYYEQLKLPGSSDEFIENLKNEMEKSLHKLNKEMPKNRKVKISKRRKDAITVSPSEPQPEPMNISALKSDLMKNWPMVNLLDILKDNDFYTGFTEHFKSTGVRENLDRSIIQKRLLLTLYGLGTNTGLKRIAKASYNQESFDELRYIKRKFITKDNLKNAITAIVNAILETRLNAIWGEGTSCASDSKKFGAWDQNLMTEWHIRYRGRGVMIYWHVEKKSACIYSQLKSCSSSEVAAMIEGVLKHCTEMKVDKNYVDTHGQSEVAFAFSHLLNFSLMPRFKAINKQKLYLPEKEIKQELENLEPALTRHINWGLIREQYDQMVKYTAALKIGTAETEAIMKRFTRNNLKHPTYKALQELGKAVKTIFLCEYLMSEELRIEINQGLNVVENWNSANGFIFYGKSGEIQNNNLEEQELSVLSLHLLQNCMVYINTLMIQEILSKKEWLNKMQAEDYRALSPLIYQHVNPYGNFELNMDERIKIQV